MIVIAWLEARRALALQNFRRKHVGFDPLDALARRKDDCALHDIAKLADVSGPVMRLKCRDGLIGKHRRRNPAIRCETREEMVGELRDILPPFAKRRKAHRDDVEPIEQVFAESPLRDLMRQVARGRGQHPHVDLHRALPADADDSSGRSVREGSCAWVVERHVGDFVQEQSAAMRLLEQARARLPSSASTPNSSSSTRSGVIIAADNDDEGPSARVLQW